MTFNEFISKYDGKGIDFDKSFGFQCFDLYRQYCKEVLNVPQSPPTGTLGASIIWDNYLKDHFNAIPNTPDVFPINGDIVIWKKAVSLPYGHVAVAISGNLKEFISFDQNWPSGSFCHKQSHNYNNVRGWLRKKGVIMPTTPSGDLQKIFDYYAVKSVDELIHMVDEQLGFLKDARSTNQKLMVQNNALTETNAFLNNQVTDFKNQSEQNQAKADQAKSDLENLWIMITNHTPTTVKNGDSTSLVAYFTQCSQNEDAIAKLQKDNQILKEQQSLQQQEMLARITTLEQALQDKNSEILVLSTQLSQLKAQVQAIGDKPVVVLKKSWLQSILEFMTRIKEQK